MANVSNLVIPEEYIRLLGSIMSPTNTRRTGSIRKAGYLPSRAQKLNVTNRSLLPQVSELWKLLTPEQQNDWKIAAKTMGQNGWNLFVQDTCYRIKYGIDGVAVPSTLHSYKVGRLEIGGTARAARLKQFHPEKYYKSVKLKGATTLRQNVAIHEVLTLPLIFSLSYRCQLEAFGADPVARAYALVKSSYQGRTIETVFDINFDLSTGWTRDAVAATDVIGIARSYDLYIEFNNVQGWFEWDNVVSQHSGANFARDARCTDVNNELTRANWQIEASWEEQILPRGANFASWYPDDEVPPMKPLGLGEVRYGDTHYGERGWQELTVGLGVANFGRLKYGE